MSEVRRYTVVVDGAAGVRLGWDDVRRPGDTEVLVRVSHSLVSPGTERHYISQMRRTGERLALGYCTVGQVVSKGELVEHVCVGDDVIAMGWNLATHSNYVVVPWKLVCRVDQGTKPAHAILATIGATAIHAGDRARLEADDRVLVVGMGLIGTMMALVAHATGCQVWAADQNSALLASRLCWTPLELNRGTQDLDGSFTKIFLCIDADITELFPKIAQLLDVSGTRSSRPKIINVGRISGNLTLSPAVGNLDIVNASRCGAGYRDDLYHHGLKDVAVVDGEARVEVNLQRCLKIMAESEGVVEKFEYRIYRIEEVLRRYNDSAFFPPGINLISHQDI
jgi:NADPH:quinone reductase